MHKDLSNHQIISASKDKTVRIWDIESGEYLKVLKGHQDSAMCWVDVLSRGRFLTVFENGFIDLWESPLMSLSLAEIRKNTRELFMANNSGIGFFAPLPKEVIFKILKYTADPDFCDEKEIDKFISDNFCKPT